MRPVYLSVQGINSFIKKQEINFEDVSGSNIFCIYGPTGAGKTTILDAIILSLYGAGSRGNIEEYINSTENSAEIIFRFRIEGELYEVQKTFNRKNTGKSFLYNLTENKLVADRTENVKAAISELLGGLTQKEFTQVVVLEQGKFDKFLSSQTADRHKTISQLFSLDKYNDLHTKFNAVAKRLESECKILQAKLEKFDDCKEDKIKELEQQNKALTESIFLLKGQSDDLQKKLLTASGDKVNFETLNKSREEFDASKIVLEAVIASRSKINVEKQALASRQNSINEEKTVLEKVKITEQNILQINDEKRQIIDLAAERKRLLLSHGETKNKYNETTQNLEEKRLEVAALQKEKTEATKKNEDYILEAKEFEDKLNLEYKQAKSEYEKAINLDMAAHLGMCLEKGDTCPVCNGVVEHKPVFENLDIEEKKRECGRLEQELEKLKQEKTAKDTIFSREVKRLDAAIEQVNLETTKLVALEATLTEQINNILERGTNIKSEIERFVLSAAKRLEAKDVLTFEQLEEFVAESRVATEQKKSECTKLVEEFEQQSSEIAAKEQSLFIEQKTLENKIKELNISMERLKDTKFDAADFEKLSQQKIETDEKLSLNTARNAEVAALLKRLSGGIKEKAVLEAELKHAVKKLDHSLELAKLFKGNKFLEYIEQEYIERFTVTASERLFALTGGKFSLEYSDTEVKSGFYVIDYLRDGERRRVGTLSGGETFLASLSLAVAISEQISSQKQFDFFFLDEGFGTLDDNAIETVADALYKLSQNTLVGVISHRPELIDKIPARIKVIPATNESGSVIDIEN